MVVVYVTTRAFAILVIRVRNVKFPVVTICLQRVLLFAPTGTALAPDITIARVHPCTLVPIVKFPFAMPFWQQIPLFARQTVLVSREICAPARMDSMVPIVKITIVMAYHTIMLPFAHPTVFA